MTRIDFYTNVGDPRHFACRAVQTVYRKGERLLVVLADDAALEAFSRALWSFGDTSFLAHCRWDAAERDASRIWLATDFVDVAQATVLLNLSPQMPVRAAAFSRILEVVGLDEHAKTVARRRYRGYLDQGCDIHHRDMSDAA